VSTEAGGGSDGAGADQGPATGDLSPSTDGGETDAGPGKRAEDGCGCRLPGPPGRSGGPWVLLFGLALWLTVRLTDRRS
jgi:hypothetical protein